jgi:hypothetical protein
MFQKVKYLDVIFKQGFEIFSKITHYYKQDKNVPVFAVVVGPSNH